MKNYLSKHYQHYYIQTDDGEWSEVTRAECIAPGEGDYSQTPTVDNPYKQRWFYDGENYSYIVRLPRNEQGEALYTLNSVFVRKEERHTARKFACVLKGTDCCDNDCDNCQRKKYPRTVELDKPIVNDGENDNKTQFFDIGEIENGYMGIEEKDAFFSLIAQLNEKQQRLIRLYYFDGKTVIEIGEILGISHQAVSKQLKKIKTVLKKYNQNI